MNTSPAEQPVPVYPCGPDTWWELHPEFIAANTSQDSGNRFSIPLEDLHGIDFKESGRKSGCAQLIPVEEVLENVEDESILIFPLDPLHKDQRFAFLETLSAVAPHVLIQAVAVSPDKDLKRRMVAPQFRASVTAREEKKAERLAATQAQSDAAHAAAIELSLHRPDGTVAPAPAAIIGSVRGLHFRLYADAIVQVSWPERGSFTNETVHYLTQNPEMQWAGSAKGLGFLRLEPTGPLVHLDIASDPTAARLSPDEADAALRQLGALYPAVRVRRIAVLADELVNIFYRGIDKKVRTAVGFIPGFTADRHLTGTGRHALAFDPVQQKLCVIDVHTWTSRIYRPADLLSVEVHEDSRMQVSHRRDGRGARRLAAAGFLVGDIFSISAGLAANNASKPKEQLLDLTLRIELADPSMPICDVRLGGSTKLSGGLHHSLSAEARTWASLIAAVIRSSEATAQGAATAAAPSIAVELAQLADLREAGHITDEEFANLKSRLLS